MPPRPLGLANHGMTCFANAVQQCLLHAPGLADRLLARRAAARVAGVDALLLAVLAEARAGRAASALGGRLVEHVYTVARASDAEQGDIDEFFLHCLEKSAAEDGALAQGFGARFFTRTTCGACAQEQPGSRVEFTSFRLACEWTDALGAACVQALVCANVGSEPALGAAHPHACARRAASPGAPATCYSRYFSGPLPQHLAVFLQRSRYRLTAAGYSAYVDDRHFELSDRLTLWEAAPGAPEPVEYDLYAAIAFKGRDLAGHYLAYVKHGAAWFSLVRPRARCASECARARRGGPDRVACRSRRTTPRCARSTARTCAARGPASSPRTSSTAGARLPAADPFPAINNKLGTWVSCSAIKNRTWIGVSLSAINKPTTDVCVVVGTKQP